MTRKPGSETHLESFTEVSNLERGGGVLDSAPLVKDVLYGDVALAYKMEDGEYVDQLTLEGLGDTEDKSGRVRLRYAPKGGPLDVMVMAARRHVSSDEERFVPEALLQQRLALPDLFFRVEVQARNQQLRPDGFIRLRLCQGVLVQRLPGSRLRLGLTIGAYTPEDQETFNQEVTIASNPGAGQLIDYLFGLYYQNIQFERFTKDLTPFGPQTMDQDIDTYAAFGEVTWNITDRFDVTGGVRYEYEEADGVGFGFVPLQVTTDSDAITPKVALGYKLTEAWRLDGLYSTGFKPGGIVRNVVLPLPTYTVRSAIHGQLRGGHQVPLGRRAHRAVGGGVLQRQSGLSAVRRSAADPDPAERWRGRGEGHQRHRQDVHWRGYAGDGRARNIVTRRSSPSTKTRLRRRTIRATRCRMRRR